MDLDENQINSNISSESGSINDVKNQFNLLVENNIIPEEYHDLLDELWNSITELADSYSSLNLLTESSLDILFRISSTGKILYISSSVEELLEYKPEELIGKSFGDLIPDGKLPEYFRSMSDQILEKEVIVFNSDLLNKTGKKFPVDEILKRISSEDSVSKFKLALESVSSVIEFQSSSNKS